MKKIIRYIKLVPLFILGLAVMIWTALFTRRSMKGDGQVAEPGEGEPPIFPY